MKRIILALLLSCITATASFAATNITTPNVSGHWTTAGSPYYIHNTITIDPGQSLIIDPGVQVLFKGQYNIVVWGSLRAAGSATDRIVFDVEDTTGWYIDTHNTYDGAWKGLYFGNYTAPSDPSGLSYCDFRHCKYTGVALDRSMYIHHCNFTDIKGNALLLKDNSTGTHEVSDCKFYNNSSTIGAVFNVSSTKAAWYVHDNEFHHNTGHVIGCGSSTLLFSRNSVYKNTGSTGLVSFSGADAAPCYVVMNENKVYDNESEKGAVIFCQFVIADITGNYICNNFHLQTANCALVDGGGAMYLMGSGDYYDAAVGYGIPSMYSVRNNVIANNYSAIYGGGIGVYNATALIANNTIVNNKAFRGGGIDIFSGDIVTVCIRNNILWGNVNESGIPGNVNLMNGSKANIKYDHNWTQYSFSTDVAISPWTYGVPTVIMGDTTTNIIGITPGIVSPTLTADHTESALAADFSLGTVSGCIDKGINAAVPASATPGNGQLDYAGNDRIMGAAVDIGAYEYSAATGIAGPRLQVDSMFKSCCAVIPPPVLGIKGTISQPAETFNIYPNPASSIVFITTPTQSGSIYLYDATGKQVMSKQVAGSITLFDVHALPRGTYFAAWTEDKTIIKKIVVE